MPGGVNIESAGSNIESGGLNIDEAKRRLQQQDRVDKKLFKDRIQQQHRVCSVLLLLLAVLFSFFSNTCTVKHYILAAS